MKINKVCEVDNCNLPHYGSGYCKKHCNQYRRHGKLFVRTIYDKNEIRCEKDICYMKIYNNKCEEIAEAIIDKKNKKKIEEFKWRRNAGGYIVSTTRLPEKPKTIFIHRLIMGDKKGLVVDHINHKPLDNRRLNLRWATPSQNIAYRTNTKGYLWDKSRDKWTASIGVNNKQIYLGRFDTEAEAKKIRIKAEKKYFGKFAPIRQAS